MSRFDYDDHQHNDKMFPMENNVEIVNWKENKEQNK